MLHVDDLVETGAEQVVMPRLRLLFRSHVIPQHQCHQGITNGLENISQIARKQPLKPRFPANSIIPNQRKYPDCQRHSGSSQGTTYKQRCCLQPQQRCKCDSRPVCPEGLSGDKIDYQQPGPDGAEHLRVADYALSLVLWNNCGALRWPSRTSIACVVCGGVPLAVVRNAIHRHVLDIIFWALLTKIFKSYC